MDMLGTFLLCESASGGMEFVTCSVKSKIQKIFPCDVDF